MQFRLVGLWDHQLTLCFARKSTEYDDGVWFVHNHTRAFGTLHNQGCVVCQLSAVCRVSLLLSELTSCAHSVPRPVTSLLSTCTRTIIRISTSRNHHHPPMLTHIINRIKAQSIRCLLHPLQAAHLCLRTRTNMTSAYSHNNPYMCQVL